MKSSLSKVLHPIGGLPILGHIWRVVEKITPAQTITVVSPDLVGHPFLTDATNVDIAIQKMPLGTADALRSGMTCLHDHITHLLILCGDTPLITEGTLTHFIAATSDLTVLAMPLDEDWQKQLPYGRIVCDEKGYPRSILEYRHADKAALSGRWANSGIYVVRRDVLERHLPTLTSCEGMEAYLTDLVEKVYGDQGTTNLVPGSYAELHGINTRQDLAYAEGVLQERWRHYIMDQGVTLLDPASTFLSYDTEVGPECVIEPHVFLGTGVRLEEGVRIHAFSYLEETHIGRNGRVGPFARLRAGVHLHEGVDVGNFVEIKKSTLEKKTKVKHLSYIGDATLGKNVNIGAGTITCNYDGLKKSKTHIEDGAFVGANTTLIAPVTIGAKSLVAAGTTVTENVPGNALAIGRERMILKRKKEKEAF